VIASILAPVSGDFGALRAVELMLIGGACGAVGVWVLHFGQAIMAESFTHALLPGLVAAAMLGVGLLFGALAGVVVAYMLILLAVRAPKTTTPNGISVAVTTLVAAGALMASSGHGVAGFESLLFGDPLAASRGDAIVSLVVAATISVVLYVFSGHFAALAFDRVAAPGLGVNIGLTTAVAFGLLALAVAACANVAGSLLALALVIGPAFGASFLCSRLAAALRLSAVVGALSGVLGIYVSWYADWPASASIAAVIVLWAVVAAAASAVRLRSTGVRRTAQVVGGSAS
jgi:ABC-type Mn2+/Zn2+ transport system permease subunit